MTRLISGLTALIAVLAFVLVFAGSAPAATATDQQLVDARSAAMKQNGQILRGAKTLSGAKAIEAASTILKNFSNFPAQFRKGSITPNSRAIPKIWDNWPDFLKRMTAEKASAQAMLAAAKSGKTADYEAAIDKLKSRCSSCHLTYAH